VHTGMASTTGPDGQGRLFEGGVRTNVGPTPLDYVRSLQRFAVAIVLAGARVPAGTSSRLFYQHAVSSWLQRSVVQQALEATTRELEYVAAAACLTQQCLDRVGLQRCDEVTRCCLRIEGINARVAADPVVT
jgi:hypothetical protein